MIANILSIAGSDRSGGAGIQADLKTIAACGGYGMACLTALTAQNTLGVQAVHVPPAGFLEAQLNAVFEDIQVDAVKIGMLANGAIVQKVAERLRHFEVRQIVLDPVLVATSGDSLGSGDVVEALMSYLLPLATLVTPNVPEAVRLTGLPEPKRMKDCEALARALMSRGARAVLIKGGHLEGATSDDLLIDGAGVKVFKAPRIQTMNTHGTGCTLSSAIATYLGQGQSLRDAIRQAKDYLTQALWHADDLEVGGGHGPVHHGWNRAAED